MSPPSSKTLATFAWVFFYFTATLPDLF